MLYGPAADAIGRRPTLLAGLSIFAVGGIGATVAGSIGFLLGARFLQGLGAGAGMSIAFTMIRDLFEGHAAQRRLAIITIVANSAPIVAPTLGAGLLRLVGWRGIYGVTAVAGLVLIAVTLLGLRETRRASAAPASGSPVARLLRDYRRLLTHGPAVRHVIVNGLSFAWAFAYISGSPLVLIGVLHVSALGFAALFACTGGAIVVGALLNGRLIRSGLAPRTVLLSAILLALLASTALAGIMLAGWLSVPAAMPLLVLTTACFGLAAPSAAHGALDPLPEIAGVAGGLLTSVQMLAGALASFLVALLFPRLGPLAMPGVMAVAAVAALLVYVPGKRQRALACHVAAEVE